MMDQTKIYKSSPAQKDLTNPSDPITLVPANRSDLPLGSGHSTKNDGIWNLKHEISSPKFYEILIKAKLKGDTALDLNNFYNNTKMCLNAVTRTR